jgi:hypothetical protein
MALYVKLQAFSMSAASAQPMAANGVRSWCSVCFRPSDQKHRAYELSGKRSRSHGATLIIAKRSYLKWWLFLRQNLTKSLPQANRQTNVRFSPAFASFWVDGKVQKRYHVWESNRLDHTTNR